MRGLNSDLTAVDTRFLHVNMMSFLQIIVCSFCCRENKHGDGRTMILHEFKTKNHQTIELLKDFFDAMLVDIYHIITFFLMLKYC